MGEVVQLREPQAETKQAGKKCEWCHDATATRRAKVGKVWLDLCVRCDTRYGS